MDKYTLLKPITFEGTEVTELEYDLNILTGRALIGLSERMSGSTAQQLMPYTAPAFQAEAFAVAAQKPVELIQSLTGADFVEVTGRVLSFLLGQE